jgi:hypothetical protein
MNEIKKEQQNAQRHIDSYFKFFAHEPEVISGPMKKELEELCNDADVGHRLWCDVEVPRFRKYLEAFYSQAMQKHFELEYLTVTVMPVPNTGENSIFEVESGISISATTIPDATIIDLN